MRGLLKGAAALALVLSLTGTALAQSGRLVLYTSQPDKDAQQTVDAFRKAHPNVQVEIFRSGTTEIMGKLAAEFSAGAPRPDLLLIADAVSMEQLKADNRLEAHAAARVEGFQPGAVDADRFYFGTKLITTGIAYNTAAKVRPESWADLMKPEFKGQISMPSPLYSGAAAIMLSAFAERQDLGWAFFDALRANDAAAVRGNGAVLRSVATGEKAYGILVDFMALNAKEKGSPVEFVFPKEGVPAVTEPVAMLRTSQNKEAARAFIDFLLSDEGQRLAVSQGYVPAKTGIKGPSWLPEGTKINVMQKDLKSVLRRTEADKKQFADKFGS